MFLYLVMLRNNTNISYSYELSNVVVSNLFPANIFYKVVLTVETYPKIIN